MKLSDASEKEICKHEAADDADAYYPNWMISKKENIMHSTITMSIKMSEMCLKLISIFVLRFDLTGQSALALPLLPTDTQPLLM